MADAASTRAHCNKCGGERNQQILYAETRKWQEDDGNFRGGDTYEMLKCRGCDSVSLRHTSWDSSVEEEQTTYYPPAVSRREPGWMTDLLLHQLTFDEDRSTVHTLLHEVYVALHNNSRSLAGMGVRAILEQAMIEKVGDQGTFTKNVVAFEAAGYISHRQAQTLTTIIEAAHAATHRGWRPSNKDLATLLDVAESVIETVYLHESQAKKLAKRVPPRKP